MSMPSRLRAVAATVLLAGCSMVGAPPASPPRGGFPGAERGAAQGAEQGADQGADQGAEQGAEQGAARDTSQHAARGAEKPEEARAAPATGPEAPRSPIPSRFAEVRGLWVIRSTLTSPDRIRRMVSDAEAGGFNTLLVQVRGRGDAYYGTVGATGAGRALEPRAEGLAGQTRDFDPLALVLDEAHARGIAVHAWINTHLVAGVGPLPSDPNHVVRARPDLLAVPRELAGELYRMDPFDRRYLQRLHAHAGANTDRLEGLYTNPSHPTVQVRIRDVWVDLAARYPLDGLHFDYIRYPGPDFDYSRASLEAFRGWAGARVSGARAAELDAAARRDPLAWTRAEPELWDAFRREQVTALVRRIHRDVKALRPEVTVSAAVFADPVDARGARYQDWESWLEEGIVDVVAPMAYSPDDGRFRRHVGHAVRVAGDPRRVWAGVGSWLTGLDGTVTKIGIARDVGAGGVVLFSYDWAAGRNGPGGVPFLDLVGRRAFRR